MSEQPTTSNARLRMHCPACDYEGETRDRHLAEELVGMHNTQRHGGEAVASVERGEAV